MKKLLSEILRERVVVADGAFGTMVQTYSLGEADFRGERFRDWPVMLKGCNDVLALTRPDVVADIHRRYLEAGADIITTDTFNANAISMRDYRMEPHVAEIARDAALLARRVVDSFMEEHPERQVFVAGSVGPTNRTASMSADVSDPGAREVTFEQLAAAYHEEIEALVRGGIDFVMIETVFDTLNAKAAIYALQLVIDETGRHIPASVSGTISDTSGRTLSGQTVEAFCASVSHAPLLCIGLNCGFGAKQLLPYAEMMAKAVSVPIIVYPNAGLPNVMGGYDETPEMFAADCRMYLERRLVNIIGGCCGTTPEHIRLLAAEASKAEPRRVGERDSETTLLSGLEPLKINATTGFVNVGERTNVAGSAKFARLIREGDYEEAISIARHQVEAGAQVVDVCMDDGLIDGPKAMRTFLNLMAAEPEISRVPVMIDSSRWDVLLSGMRCVQGKCIVNSISLKEGEKPFLDKAREIMRMGAAAVVMLFDEKGQADTYERKTEVAARAYRLLVDGGFNPTDIIIDPNILTVATGIESHNRYALDFIRATRWIKRHCPGAKVSGGVSNLSFAFRGNNPVRQAMHSAFLYHAIKAGMDMGLVNPQMLQVYSEIEPRLLECVEDVILCRRDDAAERLATLAREIKESQSGETSAPETEQWRLKRVEERIDHAMLKGITDFIEADTEEAYRLTGSALEVINSMLMVSMERVGKLFGDGKMFLPQVVKSARVMKKAVAVLTPYFNATAGEGGGGVHHAGRVVVATVKGDVHDIGKNIVAVVMACNGYEIKDLGVMVEAQDIIDNAISFKADAVCLSGLITPSLDEMIHVVTEMQRQGVAVPVIIGGATTSDMHTAVKIAPARPDGVVVHSHNASENNKILAELLSSRRALYINNVKQLQASLRREYATEQLRRDIVPYEEVMKMVAAPIQLPPVGGERDASDGLRGIASCPCCGNKLRTIPSISKVSHAGGDLEGAFVGRKVSHAGGNLEGAVGDLEEALVFTDYPIEEVEKYIDWGFFFASWGVAGRYPDVLTHKERGEEARKLLADAREMLSAFKREHTIRLQAVVGVYASRVERGDILLSERGGRTLRLPMLRSQLKSGEFRSAADFVAPTGDVAALMSCTAGVGLQDFARKMQAEHDDYQAIMAKFLCDRLTEAFAERLHLDLRRCWMGYEPQSPTDSRSVLKGKYGGIRLAFGYPSVPDHRLKRRVFDFMQVEKLTSMSLTDSCMVTPGESICALMLPRGSYFDLGPIDQSQRDDYERRMALSPIFEAVP